LTVGARALTKHAHRSSEGFWGQIKGTEAEKNEMAENIVRLIVDECIWVNAHILLIVSTLLSAEMTKDMGSDGPSRRIQRNARTTNGRRP